MTRIAILDDYQNVALDLADWNGLAGGCTVTVFASHQTEEDQSAVLKTMRCRDTL